MKLSDLITATRDVVGDPSDQTTTFSDTLVVAAINFAVANYCEKKGVTYAEAALSIASTGLATLPADVLRVNRIYTSSGHLHETRMDTEDDRLPTWRSLSSATDAIERYMLYSGNQVRVIPSPHATYSATLGYLQTPTLFSTSNLETETDARIPAVDQAYLCFAAASRLLILKTDEENIARAGNLMKIFNGLIGYQSSTDLLDTRRADGTH